MSKLLPCPFCGGVPLMMQSTHKGAVVYQLECECGVIAGSWRAREQDAVQDWNTRTQNNDALEALKRLLLSAEIGVGNYDDYNIVYKALGGKNT